MRQSLFTPADFTLDGVRLIRRQSNGIYYLTWYDSRRKNSKRKTTHTDDLEQAKRYLIEFVGKQPTSNDQKKRPDEVSIYTVINYYFQWHMTEDNPSRNTAENSFRRIIEFCEREGIETVDDLTPEMNDLYIEWRRLDNRWTRLAKKTKNEPKHQISDATISRELTDLCSALNYYKKRKKITSVPDIKKLPDTSSRDRWLTHEEVQRLLDACGPGHLHDYTMLALHTVQRPQAIYRLTVDRVDFTGRLIDFRLPGAPQSRKRRPIVRMSDTLVPLLQRLAEESMSGFILEYEGQAIVSTLRKAFKKASKRAGLGDDVTPNTLRHTGATWLAQAGVDLWEIAGMMGHTQARTTELYAKHSPKFQQHATSILDSMLPGAAGNNSLTPPLTILPSEPEARLNTLNAETDCHSYHLDTV